MLLTKPKILLTGATGFVGKALACELVLQNYQVRVHVRSERSYVHDGVEKNCIGDIAVMSDWLPMLKNVDVLIYAAARVHVMQDDEGDPLAEFRKVNTYAALSLAGKASQTGVKRFIYISSVKVNGEMSALKKPFTPEDQFIPDDPYGLSKYEAEQGLLALAKKTGMEVVIIRPPLVYGPEVRANFASMMRWVNKGIPLPFGAIHNQRSLVALDNLVSFIVHCIDHPKAANEVFLISDGEDVSTTELLHKVAKALNKKSRLIPIPVSFMRFVAKLVGKSDVADRLFGSLQVDSSKARDLLDWKPVTTMDEQLQKTALAFLSKK